MMICCKDIGCWRAYWPNLEEREQQNENGSDKRSLLNKSGSMCS